MPTGQTYLQRGPMDTYIARQPIFDRERNIHGYELLFRDSLVNVFPGHDVDSAARKMIRDSAVLFGIDNLTGGKKAFVNLTRESLVKGYARLLPPEHAVLEILETVEADREVLSACLGLKRLGYTLALDDFVFRGGFNPLVDVVDLVKIDFLVTRGRERRQLFERLAPLGKICLAEKLETPQDFHEAREIGYHLFQGFFLDRPVVLTQSGIPENKRGLLRFLRETHEPQLNHGTLADHVKGDLNLAFSLLRHLKPRMLGRDDLHSVEQALSLMDDTATRHWATAAAATSLAQKNPMALMTAAARRGRMCELLAKHAGYETAANFCLVGLLSHAGAMLDRDLQACLGDLTLETKLEAALLQREENEYRLVYEIVLAHERGDTPAVARWCHRLKLAPDVVASSYLESVAWAEKIHG